MSQPAPLFRFCQVEFPWALGPPDGRYLLRAADASPSAARRLADAPNRHERNPAQPGFARSGPDSAPTRPAVKPSHPDSPPARPDSAPTRPAVKPNPDSPPARPDLAPSHVLVFSTLGALKRGRLERARPHHKAEPEPEPEPVTTTRATVIDVGEPLVDLVQAQKWLQTAGEPDLLCGMGVLNRVLHTFRLVSADPYLNVISRQRVLVARIGFGAGEQVADGLWTEALELVSPGGRQRRARMLAPQASLAAVLSGRRRSLVCEELTLRARLDVDQGHDRQAALQVLIALDATLAELSLDPAAPLLADRLNELRGRRDAVADAGQAALAGPVGHEDREAVLITLSQIEAALRARAVAADG